MCVTYFVNIQKNNEVCENCAGKNEDYAIQHNLLPIWYDNNKQPHYEVPDELSDLYDAEKMLIQRMSPFIPLHHIKNGTFGLKGHVCTFVQDISTICNKLPRKPDSIEIIKVIHHYQNEIKGDMCRKVFKVRRSKVLQALKWLKEHHVGYKDINIEPKNMDWIPEEKDEGNLEPSEIHDVFHPHGTADMEDMGPAPNQTEKPKNNNMEDMQGEYGLLSEDQSSYASKRDKVTSKMLEEAALKGNAVDTMSWPSILTDPVSEYRQHSNIFSLAFPWLFPGGIGDFYDDHGEMKISANQWARNMLLYFDGRFAIDKMFCFFALDFMNRRRNQSNGRFFVKKFCGDCPTSIEEMKERIAQGDIDFIKKLQYFSNTIQGSSSYWREKKDEVHSWIRHHVEAGHGPPTFFITLSCAEYYWPDIFRLLQDRLKYTDQKYMTSEQIQKSVVQLVNQYSIVIQEYFQKRVQVFLETVGEKILKIEHYWVRFEFAPSRGQIHAHLLAISPKTMMQQQYFENKKDTKKQANDLANWAKKMFGLTAYLQKEVTTFQVQPCSVKYTDIQDCEDDINNLLNAVQKHKCNSYCISDMTKKPIKTKQQQSNEQNQDDNKKEKEKKNEKENAGWDMVRR